MRDRGNNWAVVIVNEAGVAEAFGLYTADEAERSAAFLQRLVPTWVLDLDHDDLTARMGTPPATAPPAPPPAEAESDGTD